MNNCQACRYWKCLSVGMNPKAAGRYIEREAQVIGLIPKKELQLSINRITHYFSSGFKFVAILKSSASTLLFAQQLINMETEILNSSSAIPSEMYANVDCSLADVLLNSQICCPRDAPYLSNWKDEERKYNTLRYSHCRGIVKYVDFLTALPDFHSIQGADKLKLTQEKLTSAQYLTTLYKMWNKSVNSFEERLGAYQLPEEQQKIVNSITAGLQTLGKKICGLFDRLSLRHEELILLKVIHIFSAEIGYSESGLSTIQEARTKHLILLASLIQELFPFLSESERLERLIMSLEILRLTSNVKEIVLCACRKLFAVNADQLAGNLTYDFYVREY